MGKDEIIDLTQKLYSVVEIDTEKSESNFDLIANGSLSGLEGQCSALECRENNLNYLMRKAALHANKVWVNYPLEKYEKIVDRDVNIERVRESLVDDISILHRYRKMIESGIFAFAKTEKHFCFDCFGSLSDQVDWSIVERVEKLKKDLTKRFAYGAKYNIIEWDDDTFSLEIEAEDKSLFEHEGLVYELIDPYAEFPKAMKRKSLKVKSKEVMKSEQVNGLVNKVLKNIVMQSWYVDNIGANYLTNTPIEFESMMHLNNKATSSSSSKLYENLSHALPVVKNIGIEKLIELRENEPEAFINYRNSIDSVLKEHKNLSKSQLKDVLLSEIQPHIDQMSQTINSHKKKLVRNTIHNFVTGSSLIGFALCSGLLPAGVSYGLVTLAGYHKGVKVLDNMKELLSKEYESKDEKYYFLWKALN